MTLSSLRGYSATECGTKSELWVKIKQRYEGLVGRLWVDNKRLNGFVNPLSSGVALAIILIAWKFKFWYENNNISNIGPRGGWTGLRIEKKVGGFPLFFLFPLSSHRAKYYQFAKFQYIMIFLAEQITPSWEKKALS